MTFGTLLYPPHAWGDSSWQPGTRRPLADPPPVVRKQQEESPNFLDGREAQFPSLASRVSVFPLFSFPLFFQFLLGLVLFSLLFHCTSLSFSSLYLCRLLLFSSVPFSCPSLFLSSVLSPLLGSISCLVFLVVFSCSSLSRSFLFPALFLALLLDFCFFPSSSSSSCSSFPQYLFCFFRDFVSLLLLVVQWSSGQLQGQQLALLPGDPDHHRGDLTEPRFLPLSPSWGCARRQLRLSFPPPLFSLPPLRPNGHPSCGTVW